MTSITSNMASAQGWSPLNRLQNQLQRAVDNGTVKSDDQSALSSALTDIDTQLRASASGGTSVGSGATPASMKSQVSSLIDDEVSSGKLTSDQATELKGVFAQASHHMHGHHHAAPPSGSDDGSSTDPSSTPSTGGPLAGLMNFVKQLEGALKVGPSSAASGVGGTSGISTSGGTTSSDTNSGSSTQTVSSDPVQALTGFLRQLESALSSNGLYNQTGSAGSTTTSPVLINGLA